jgi:hypothetical protein
MNEFAWIIIYKEGGVLKYKAFKMLSETELIGVFSSITSNAFIYLILKVPRYLAVVTGVGILRSIAKMGTSFWNLFEPYPHPEMVLKHLFTTPRGDVILLCPIYVDREYGVLVPAKKFEGCVGYVTHPDSIAPFARVLIDK